MLVEVASEEDGERGRVAEGGEGSVAGEGSVGGEERMRVERLSRCSDVGGVS